MAHLMFGLEAVSCISHNTMRVTTSRNIDKKKDEDYIHSTRVWCFPICFIPLFCILSEIPPLVDLHVLRVWGASHLLF